VILAAAFVPSTPLLVPEVGVGADDLDDVRAASETALREALTSGAQRVVVLGSTPPAGAGSWPHADTTTMRRSGTGTLRGFGVALDVALDPALPDPAPLSLTSALGAWLLTRVGWEGERLAVEVAPSAPDTELDVIGAGLADGVPTVLLVVGDGSAARSDRAPASLHPDAERFDASVAAALAGGEPAALAGLDRDVATAVSAAGRPAWRVAAAAAAGSAYDAALLADAAPLGVGYLVARWLRC
jgi:hypothetical protein